MLSEQLAASGTLTAGFFPIELIHSYYMQFFGICQGTQQKSRQSKPVKAALLFHQSVIGLLVIPKCGQIDPAHLPIH